MSARVRRTAGSREQARWQLLDAARGYDGCNLLWCTDADELVAPRRPAASSTARANELTPGTVGRVPLLPSLARTGQVSQRPSRRTAATGNSSALVDDRQDGLRPVAPCCRCTSRASRSTARAGRSGREDVRGAAPAVAARRAQPDAAGVVPLPRMAGSAAKRRRRSTTFYSVTLARPSRADRGGAGGVGRGRHLPGPGRRSRTVVARARHPRLVRASTAEFFEPLEIWHIPVLRAAFERRAGRRPRPDRSYRPSWPVRARRFGRRVAAAARRRIALTCDMARPFLTVLTAPISGDTAPPVPGAQTPACARSSSPASRCRRSSPYPGHYALVRSVVEGLRAIDADFNFNPRRLGDLARVVYAPANDALRQAAGLKRRREHRLSRRRPGERAVRRRERRHSAACRRSIA